MKAEKFAQGLGWFSLGLGLYEALAPGRLSRTLGLEGREKLLRFYGLREIMAGVGIFASEPRPAVWVWARVAGDALDLATLRLALKSDNPNRSSAMMAFAAVTCVTVLDVLCGQQLSTQPGDDGEASAEG